MKNKMDKIKLLKRVHKMRENGLTSLEVASRIRLPLIKVNRLFLTRIPDPENKNFFAQRKRGG